MESEKKRTVLIFTDWFAPAYKAGGPITSCVNLVQNLNHSFDFKIVCSDRDYMDSEPLKKVKSDKWTRFLEADVLYQSKANESYQSIKKRIGECDPDVIYINGLWSRIYSIYPLLASRFSGKKVIIAPRGMLAPGALSLKSGKKKAFLSLIKFLKSYKRCFFHATHQEEALQIRKHLGMVRAIEVIPNIPGISGVQPDRKSSKQRGKLKLLTVGRIAQEKNTLYALECLQRLSADVEVDYTLVGAVYHQAYLERCRNTIGHLPSNISVKFINALPPEEISKKYVEADLFFSPTLGENYGHAIIEAMLSGTPVLISDRTPWNDLEQKGVGFEFGLDAQSNFTQAIEKVARMDQEDYKRSFSDISVKAGTLVHLEDTLERYKKLFG